MIKNVNLPWEISHDALQKQIQMNFSILDDLVYLSHLLLVNPNV